ncbi:unnamed protein product [Rotaria socialis]|uniref:Uncharacterized protein n=1 Tax=Rotaria socialis TaxID=392032 RepID=A0A821BU33_9BILA|nr:unnamed protein product [Rotaria socialis]
MKRSASSISKNRDVTTSRIKRSRLATPSEQEEDVFEADNDVENSYGKENMITSMPKCVKENLTQNNVNSGDSNPTAVDRTPLRSTISFCSSSSKDVASLTNSTSIRTTTDCNPNEHHSNSQSVFHFSFTQGQSDNSLFRPNRLSSLVDRNSSITNKPTPSAYVEGSLEYRELKRSYLFEKKQASEWKKDYAVLKHQLNELKSTTLPRPTAEALDWLRELFDLLDNNATFRGDGRSLDKIGEDLGLDSTNLITVAARTPQKSALKLFRILYPTIGSRANCISISNIPDEKLTNIYLYVRVLHQNLSFKMSDMRRAIGTSIRSATHEMRKLEHERQEQLNELENDENLDQAEREDRINHAMDNMEMALNASDTATCDEEDDENEDIDKMSMDEEIYGDDDDDEL